MLPNLYKLNYDLNIDTIPSIIVRVLRSVKSQFSINFAEKYD